VFCLVCFVLFCLISRRGSGCFGGFCCCGVFGVCGFGFFWGFCCGGFLRLVFVVFFSGFLVGLGFLNNVFLCIVGVVCLGFGLYCGFGFVDIMFCSQFGFFVWLFDVLVLVLFGCFWLIIEMVCFCVVGLVFLRGLCLCIIDSAICVFGVCATLF